MAAAVVEISYPNHTKFLFETLQNFALNEKFTDICFVCANNKKVFTHKLLLCSVSEYMKRIIMEMPVVNDIITIHIPDARRKIVNLVVNFLYNGSLRLSQEQYNDFQETVKLLGILLCVNDKNLKAEQQPTPQPQAYQPVVNMQQPMHSTSQVQSDQQYIYVRSEEENNQGMQFIIPEQTQYTTMPQPSSSMMRVQEPIQAIPVNTQDMMQVQPRNQVQARNHNVVSNQAISRNSNVVQMPNQIQVQQGQYQVAQRSHQINQGRSQNVQYGMGQNVSRRGITYNVPNHQALANTPHIQNNQNPNALTRGSTSTGVRRRRLIQQPQLQMEAPSTSTKRSRDTL